MNIMINCLTLNRGGTERVIANLCNDFLINKYKITIVTSALTKPKYNLNDEISIISLDSLQTQIYENKVIRFIRRRKELKRVIKKLNPDFIISFLPEPNFLLLSLKMFYNCPVIISVRNDPKIEYSKLVYRILMKVLYPFSDGYVFQTEDAKQYFKFNTKILNESVVIPNPINTDFIAKPYNGERRKEIVSVGRFDLQKNHTLLINAFSKVVKDFGEYKLIIYGEGKLRPVLEEQIKLLGLEEKIILPGEKQNIKELIYRSAVFVLSSNYEGMPNALMEAMALGLPVISTDCPSGGPKLLINNEINGLLVNVGCEEKLAEAMKRVISNLDYSNSLSVEAAKISKRFEPNKIYQMWDEFIQQVYKNSK